MKSILVNGISAKAGGGKNIFENFLLTLSRRELIHNYYILTPNAPSYRSFESDNIHIIDVKSIFKRKFSFPLLYFFVFSRLLSTYKIDVIFNFGDIIIPTKVKQIYFFDWAYALYDEDYIWSRMSKADYFIRRIKVFLIDKYIEAVDIVLCQNLNMANRLESRYRLQDLCVVPTPVDFLGGDRYLSLYQFPDSKVKFLYPSSFSPHKNFEIVIPLAELIRERGYNFLIVLTLDSTASTLFFEEISNRGLAGIVCNVGRVDLERIPALYRSVDALFFPSLIESYGLPYFEAMLFEKPIITSDLDFARDACGLAAKYFNPFDPISIIEAMKVLLDDNAILSMIDCGRTRVAEIPTWEIVVDKFQENIEKLLS